MDKEKIQQIKEDTKILLDSCKKNLQEAAELRKQIQETRNEIKTLLASRKNISLVMSNTKNQQLES